MEIDNINITPEMSPRDLEKILKNLPEPTNVEVYLFNFDSSDIYNQALNYANIKLEDGQGLRFSLEEPSKKNILDIYKKAYEFHSIRGEVIATRAGEEPDESTKQKIKKKSEIIRRKRIDLKEAKWYLDNNVEIRVSPTEVYVKYPLHGLEPEYISKLKKELATTNVNLRMQVGKDNKPFLS